MQQNSFTVCMLCIWPTVLYNVYEWTRRNLTARARVCMIAGVCKFACDCQRQRQRDTDRQRDGGGDRNPPLLTTTTTRTRFEQTLFFLLAGTTHASASHLRHITSDQQVRSSSNGTSRTDCLADREREQEAERQTKRQREGRSLLSMTYLIRKVHQSPEK